MNLLADVLATVGEALGKTTSNACVVVMLDEPECPESLIK